MKCKSDVVKLGELRVCRYVFFNVSEVLLVFFGMELKLFIVVLISNMCYFFNFYGRKEKCLIF